MALREDLESTGGWLFRWRSYFPVIMLGIIVLGMMDLGYPADFDAISRNWEYVCLGVSFFGLFIRIMTIGFTPVGTSGRNTKSQVANTLNTSGIYATVRNPLYLGNFFMGLGLALYLQLWWLGFIYFLLFFIYYERIILAEEAFLREKFGQAYLDWAEQTPAIIPKLGQYSKADLSFSLRNVLKREYSGFAAVIVTFVVLKFILSWFSPEDFELDLFWQVLLGVGLGAWLILRTLKKTTKLLHVKGR